MPTQTARHVSRRSRWKHNPAELRELSAWGTDPSGPVLPSCSHKHVQTFESNVGRRETCLLAMRVGLDRSRFPRSRSHVTPGAPARKQVFETALDGPARTQSDVFLVLLRTGNPLVKTVFLRGQRKLTKNSSTDFYTARHNCYNRRRTTKLRRARSSIHHENNHTGRNWGRWKKKQAKFGVFFGVLLALFLSRFKCVFFKWSLRQRRDALKSLLQVWILKICGRNGNADSMLLLMRLLQEWLQLAAASNGVVLGWFNNSSVSSINKSPCTDAL